ncbi:phthiocerol/phthiodiolone dimycocerosyl transferase family protein [Mycolicibacterium baixiangningiae]|uniref:phthiocerol/phthiodiolone dimycocerosyl transferase family protein n=1 Tax=Mycolicibacterium baixiangningiae TaxID=2761578 RepID=UPI001867E417|nr:acyltransferase [Mycolicibacterium baixiangningiae]
MVFPTSVIRSLAPSEQWYAESQTFGAITIQLTGSFDPDAMSDAFDALLQAHPILSGHLESGPDGRYEIVTDDLMHPGIWLRELGGSASETPRPDLDPDVSLINLMVRPGEACAEVTLYVHHSVADGNHAAALLFELFSRYTDMVCTGLPGPAGVEPAPESLEALLSQRGIQKIPRSGLERFMPAMFAYPPATRPGAPTPPPSTPTRPVPAPTARGRLTKEETTALVEFGLGHRLFLNPLVSAAILLAEWRLRGTPDVPVPYVYVVDLRMLLTPPVPVMGATNPLGMATYLAMITSNTTLAELGRDIAANLATDVAEGVVQQSMLHFKPQYDEGQRGLPDVVSSTNFGRTPILRTPPELHVDEWHTDIYRASSVLDMYSVGIFGERLAVEYHTYATDPERSVDLVLEILRDAGRRGQR